MRFFSFRVPYTRETSRRDMLLVIVTGLRRRADCDLIRFSAAMSILEHPPARPCSRCVCVRVRMDIPAYMFVHQDSTFRQTHTRFIRTVHRSHVLFGTHVGVLWRGASLPIFPGCSAASCVLLPLSHPIAIVSYKMWFTHLFASAPWRGGRAAEFTTSSSTPGYAYTQSSCA